MDRHQLVPCPSTFGSQTLCEAGTTCQNSHTEIKEKISLGATTFLG